MNTPYDTTYGSLLNTVKVKEELTRYLSTADLGDLSYNYVTTGTIKTAYITGYCLEEQELPLWEHPIVVKTIRNEEVVVSDLRRYVKKHTEISPTLEDITKDVSSMNFIVLSTLLTKDYLQEDMGKHREVFRPTTTAYGVWISGMVNTIVMLTPLEQFSIEIMASMFANRVAYPSAEDSIETIIARVSSSKHVYKLNKKYIKELGDKYVVSDGSINELIINLKLAVADDKTELITIDSLISVMGNVWYGPGGSETPIIALEYTPVWMAVLHSVVTNRSYSKSRIGTLLNKHNRVIDSKVIDKHFTNYLNEIKV